MMKKEKQQRKRQSHNEEGRTTKEGKARKKGRGKKKRKKNSSFCYAKTQNTLQNLSTKQQQNKQKLHKTHTHEQTQKLGTQAKPLQPKQEHKWLVKRKDKVKNKGMLGIIYFMLV